MLAHVDHFVTTQGGDLTSDSFAGWCLTLQHLASGTRRSRMRIVRNFCLYRRRGELASFLPDALLFPPRHQVVRPHLFTNAEVVRLLAAIGALPAAPTSPFRRENLHLAIVLLYTAGLRLGERPIDQLRLAPERRPHLSGLHTRFTRCSVRKSPSSSDASEPEGHRQSPEAQRIPVRAAVDGAAGLREYRKHRTTVRSPQRKSSINKTPPAVCGRSVRGWRSVIWWFSSICCGRFFLTQ